MEPRLSFPIHCGVWIAVFAGVLATAGLQAVQAAPIQQDFENDAGSWNAIGDGAKVEVVHDAPHVKNGNGALRFDYTVQKGGFQVMLMPVQPGALAPVKSIRFWVLTDKLTPIVVALQEKDGGRYTAVFTAPAGKWQEVRLSPADFVLSTGPDDPKDPDGKLDLDQVGQVGLFDLEQMFAQVDNPALSALFNIKTGPRILCLDDFTASEEAPAGHPVPDKKISIDEFDRPQISWVCVGDSQVNIVTGAPLKGAGMQATYHEAAGKIAGWFKPVRPGLLKGAARLSFPVASGMATKVLVQMEETNGGKYNATVDVPGGSELKDASLAFADFKASDDSHDSNDKLDLDQVKQVLILDTSGFTGGAEGDNTLWIGPLRASLPAAVSPAAKTVTGRIVTLTGSAPIAGANITLSEGDDPDPISETQTLINGSFLLKAPWAGKFRLRATHGSYALVEKEIDTGDNGAVQVAMTVRPVVHLRVLSPEGKALLIGATEAAVRVVSASGIMLGTAAQEKFEDGAMDVTFDHSFPATGVRSVSVFTRNAASGCADLTMDHWPAEPVQVRLDRGASISGTVVDAARKPMGQAPIIAFRMLNGGILPDITQHAFAITDSNGKFTLPALPQGVWGLLVKAPTAQSKLSLVTLKSPLATASLVADQKPGK